MPQSTFTWYPERQDVISWEVREVVHDIDARPHLLLRIELVGVHFPGRALPPFMRVGKLRSRFVRLDSDGLRAFGYFDARPPDRGTIAFGYGEQVVLQVHDDYVHDLPAPLDRGRLPEGIRAYDTPTESPG